MPRTKRVAPGGMVFHALNRGVGRMKVFSSARDYAAFEETGAETLRSYPLRLLAYCWLPNHWHFVLWPEEAGQLSAFLQRLTNGISIRCCGTWSETRCVPGVWCKNSDERQLIENAVLVRPAGSGKSAEAGPAEPRIGPALPSWDCLVARSAQRQTRRGVYCGTTERVRLPGDNSNGAFRRAVHDIRSDRLLRPRAALIR
jgi:REP element-mobilizing transposase RayT